jgi:hypothetical protein
VEPVPDGTAEPELLTHPFPPVVDTSDQGEHRRPEHARPADAGDEDGADPDGYPGGDSYAGWRPRPVPEGTGDTGARPNQPVRHFRTTEATDPE